MGTSASSINNIATTVLINLNFQVFFNIFFSTVAVTGGIIFASKVIGFFMNPIAEYLKYKFTSKYQRKTDEIKELNNKIHDKLVEVNNFIEEGDVDNRARNTKWSLLYNASRLKKYDPSITLDIDQLCKNLYFDASNRVVIKNAEQCIKLIEEIRIKVDKIWFDKLSIFKK